MSGPAPRILALMILSASVLPGMTGSARADVPLDDDSSEAQLMGFYAGALAFTPAGRPAGDRLEFGLETTWLPHLSADDRDTTFAGAKVENTNFTQVLPRPRVRWRPSSDWLLEAGFVPPVEMFGVTPEQYGVAGSYRVAGRTAPVGFWVRGHYLDADIIGPITCSEEAVQDPANVVCFGGQASEDHFKPESYGLDFVLDGTIAPVEGLGWYAAAGWEHQTLRFATHFVNVFGRLDDQRLVARVDRASFLGGITWSERHGLRLSFEASYMPDALATARFAIGWAWGKR
jgi:hypothetical protein